MLNISNNAIQITIPIRNPIVKFVGLYSILFLSVSSEDNIKIKPMIKHIEN